MNPIEGFILFPAGNPRGTLAMMVASDCRDLPGMTHVSPITAPGCGIWFMVVRYSDTSMTAIVIVETDAVAAKYFPNERLFMDNFEDAAIRFLKKYSPGAEAQYMTVFNNYFGRGFK